MSATQKKKNRYSGKPHRSDRRALLAKVHIAKKDLALPDDVYRVVL